MSNSHFHTTFVVIILFWLSNGLAYVNWNYNIMGPFLTLMYLSTPLVFLKCRPLFKNIKLVLTKSVVFLTISPLFCLFIMQLYYGQFFLESRQHVFEILLFLLFYIFIAYKVHPNSIMRGLLTIGLIVLFFQVVQQFDPYSAQFGVLTEDQMLEMGFKDNIEIRNGLNRFRFDALFYVTLICTFYSWEQLLNKIKLRNLCLLICFLISIYLYLARQIIAVVIITIVFSLIANRRRLFMGLFVGSLIFLFLLPYVKIIFGELIESTSDNLNTDYIRFFEYVFFAEKIFESPVLMLFGHGFLSEEQTWREVYHYYTADVGIVGAVYYYGFIWLFSYAYMFYKVLMRCRTAIPLYLKLFFLAIAMDSILIHPMERGSHIFVLVSALYMVEWYCQQGKNLNFCRNNGQKKLYKKHSFK